MSITRSIMQRLHPSWYHAKRYQFCEGYIDHIKNGTLVGWIYDYTLPNRILSVDIYCGTNHLARVTANEFRDDLLKAGKGNGQHGFSYRMPSQSTEVPEDDIRVCYAGTMDDIMLPVQSFDLRKQLSRKYLKGKGIEIGALHNPLWVADRARVSYVDRMNMEALRAHYPELRKFRLTPVDIIDDGERLITIPEASQDFIIINHMLEHCENPLGTIRTHMSKLKKGGILYCTVPDMRFFKDTSRSLTPFDHLVDDDRKGHELSRLQHYLEWVLHWETHVPREHAEVRAKELMSQHYSIHFHVWTERTFREFIEKSHDYLDGCFKAEEIAFKNNEVIAILRKN